MLGWSNGALSFQVPTPSGPNRQVGSTLGADLWMIPAGDTGCVAVTTSAGTSGTASFTAQAPSTTSYASSGWTVGLNGSGVYGLRGGNVGPGGSVPLVCSDNGQWVWDGLMNTPAGGPSGLPRCANYPPDL